VGEKTNAHRVLVGKPEEAAWKILGTGKNNIKMNPKGRVWVVLGSSEQVHVVGYSKHGNGTVPQIAQNFFQMRTYWVLEGSAPRS
jgi:hypothetical protein